MGVITTSIVINFGADVGEGQLVAELDEVANGGVTQFPLNSDAYFIVYKNPSTIVVDRPKASDGQVTELLDVVREQKEQLTFAGTKEAKLRLKSIAGSFFVEKWYGAQGSGISCNGDTVTITGGDPCIADVKYNSQGKQYKLVPPVGLISMANITQYPIVVVITGTL